MAEIPDAERLLRLALALGFSASTALAACDHTVAMGSLDAGSSGLQGSSGRVESSQDLPEPEACSPVHIPADRVVMLGDSYFDGTDVAERLWELARDHGALGPRDEYRHYYKGGSRLATGEISAQFQAALAEDPSIEVVLMTGGGNDVLLAAAAPCLAEGVDDPSCVDALDDVEVAAASLWSEMNDAGVVDLVYVSYANLRSSTSETSNAVLDRLASRLGDGCEALVMPRCVFVDPRESFDGHPEYLQSDGVHPAPAGAEVLAALIWATLERHCVAQ